MTAPYNSEFSLIDLVLAEQRDMTAVERFSSFHDYAQREPATYRDLIPLAHPKSGEQYAFVVDLDRCSGCKACVSACHSLNGLEEGEMWRSTGTVVGESSPYLQTITSSCHHCVDPACAAGCPVLAYEKDVETGIVRHLDDQCIGCQYCVLKCPYDVPKYSRSKGIVRKCDLCQSRLAAGEAPACAQACPHEAIRIEIVSQKSLRDTLSIPGARMLPGAFPSNYTLPTTRYVSKKNIPTLKPAVARSTREQAHWPLIVMLLLTQAAFGLHVYAVCLQIKEQRNWSELFAKTAAVMLFSGLSASVLHLGRPLKAWRAFLGWRRSWMSREILGFTAYAGLAAAMLVRPSDQMLGIATALVGLCSVACSVMIYVDTRRPGWSARILFPSFLGSGLLLGAAVGAAISARTGPGIAAGFTVIAIFLRTILFALRRNRNRLELALFAVSTFCSLVVILDGSSWAPMWSSAACFFTVAAQLQVRWLFFVATPAARMPGFLPA